MIEAVTAVARADAVTLATEAGAGRAIEGRIRRLRWLDALRAANGEPLPIDDEARDEDILEESRARIRAALGTIKELDSFARADDEEALASPPDVPVSASAIAGMIRAHRDAALAAQAHLHAAAVGRILG
jgi:hypothetical protein